AYDAQSSLIIARHKIGQRKTNTLFFDHIIKIAQRLTEIGTLTCWLKVNQFTDNAQNMLLSFFGRNEFFYPVAKKKYAHFIIIIDRRKGKYGAYLGQDFIFHLCRSAKKRRAAHICQQHHGKFAFFFKYFNVRFAGTCSHIPVYGAHIVAILILPHLAERHTPAFESAVIFAGKNMAAQAPRLDFYLPDFFYQFGRVHLKYLDFKSVYFLKNADKIFQTATHYSTFVILHL